MWYYPKRQDGVLALQFDGTQAAAQSIAAALKVPVHHQLPETLKVGDHGGTLDIPGADNAFVRVADYVVIGTDRDLIEVLGGREFHDKYSKDGL